MRNSGSSSLSISTNNSGAYKMVIWRDRNAMPSIAPASQALRRSMVAHSAMDTKKNPTSCAKNHTLSPRSAT